MPASSHQTFDMVSPIFLILCEEGGTHRLTVSVSLHVQAI